MKPGLDRSRIFPHTGHFAILMADWTRKSGLPYLPPGRGHIPGVKKANSLDYYPLPEIPTPAE
jgi:hypothetical protein